MSTTTLMDVQVATATTYAPPHDAYDVEDVAFASQFKAGAYDDPAEEAKIMSEMNTTVQMGEDGDGEHARPPVPSWCKRVYMWLPVRLAAFMCGLAYVVLPILAFILGSPSFLAVFINLLLIVFGLVTCCVELPKWPVTRKVQLKVFYWARFMSTTWGRSIFYLFVALLTFAMVQDGFQVVAIAAIAQVVVALGMLVVSRMAARKYMRLVQFLQAGLEGDEMVMVVANKFDAYDQMSDGRLHAAAIRKMAADAGRLLTNAERHAIQSFLDESCTGAVTKPDFLKRMQHNTNMKWL